LSQKSSSIDLLNRLSSGAGWSADRSRLSEEEISGLAEMIEPALNGETFDERAKRRKAELRSSQND
jgi:hypothetical protein